MTFNPLMHERNIYKNRPDFVKLAIEYPEFRKYIYPDAKGKYHVDFTDTNTLRVLTKVLLHKDFNLSVQIPDGFLIPTVPQRLNYILWVEDLLAANLKHNDNIKGIDIGTGPCAIFSLLGAKKNGWKFIATESSDDAIRWATENVETNNLQSNIKIAKVSKDSTLKEILESDEEVYNFCLCNPPFFENIDEIRTKHSRSKQTVADIARGEEIFAEGGEVSFVRNMLKDSLLFKNRVEIYTSMFGKKKSFLQILSELKKVSDVKFTTSEFCQGNTVRWGVAWTFIKSFEFPKVKKVKLGTKPKKAKPPLVYNLPETIHNPAVIVTPILEQILNIMNELEIPINVVRSSKNFAEIQIKAIKNTWSNQRRKRREMMRKSGNLPKDEILQKTGETIDHTSQPRDNNASSIELPNTNASFQSQNIIKPEKPTNLEIVTEIFDSSVRNEENLKIYVSEKKYFQDESADISKNETAITVKTENCDSEYFYSKRKRNSEGYAEDVKHEVESESKNLCSKIKEETDSKLPSISKRIKLDSDVRNIHKNEISITVKMENHSDSANFCRKRKRDSEDCAEHLKDEIESESKKLCSKIKEENDFELPSTSKRNQLDSDSKDAEAILSCYLLIRKAKDHILLEMNGSSEADRQTMHQVFQLIKNKLK